MKRFIIKTAAFVAAFVVLIVALIVLLPYNPNGYNLAYFKKIEALTQSRESGLILVGGSNVAFGIDSKYISNQLGMPVYNFGLHAGLGLELMLNDIEKYSQEGDIVCLIPECSHFFNDMAYGEQPLADIFFLCPQTAERLSTQHISTIISNLFPHIQSRRDYLLKSIVNYSNDTPYTLTAFNEYGDVVWHWNKQRYTSITHNKFAGDINDNIVDHLKNICDYLNDNGVQTIILPPACAESFFTSNESNIKNLSEVLIAQDIVENYDLFQATQNDTLFYDTDHHLTYTGILNNCDRIINAVSSIIKQ